MTDGSPSNPNSKRRRLWITLAVAVLLVLLAIVVEATRIVRWSALKAQWDVYATPCKGLDESLDTRLIPLEVELDEPIQEPFHGAISKPSKLYGFQTNSREVVIEPRFLKVFDFNQGLALVRDTDGWGYINEAGEWILPPGEIVHGYDFREDRARVYTQSDWGKPRQYGYINPSGTFAIQMTLDSATDFCGDLALVGEERWWSKVISSFFYIEGSPWRPIRRYWVINPNGQLASLPQ